MKRLNQLYVVCEPYREVTNEYDLLVTNIMVPGVIHHIYIETFIVI